MLNIALQAAERGLLPDSLMRFGIRQLLKQRVKSFDPASSTRFVNSLSSSPVALLPEAANSQHYEVPSEFFALSLGTFRKYSSCLWDTATSLEDAEKEMLSLTTERAEISNGMNVLDLGCGWGSFILFAAQKFPHSKFTGVSNSNSQREFILNQCKNKRLSNVTILTADMNTFAPPEKYDRIVSVEMFEHMRNYEILFQRISGWLNDGGKFFLHIFTHKEFSYPFETEGEDNWMGRYFFSGGMMPAHTLPSNFQRDLQITKTWKVSGQHYAQTCEAWLKNHDANEQRIKQIFQSTYGPSAQKWFHRWRIFFLSCAELFAFREGQDWFVSHYLLSKQEKSA